MEEITFDSPSEKLLEFLLKAGCGTEILSEAMTMFNPVFDLDILMSHLRVPLSTEFQNFDDFIQGQIFNLDNKDYVHLTAVAKEAKEKSQITKKFRKLNSNVYNKPSHLLCPIHQNQPCNLVQKSLAFLFFLYLDVDLKQGKSEDVCHASVDENVVILSELEKDEVARLEEPFDEENEKEASSNLDVSLFKAETVLENNFSPPDEPITEKSMIVSTLPFFHINGKDFVLLNHIQSLFSLREDYCLGIVAEGCDVAKGFIDIEEQKKDEFLALDLNTTNDSFIEANSALTLCLERVSEEPPTLKDEDFEDRLVQLGVQNFGRESFFKQSSEGGKDVKEKKVMKAHSSLDLFKESILAEDENPKVTALLFLLILAIHK